MNQIDSAELVDYYKSWVKMYAIGNHGMTSLQRDEEKRIFLDEGKKFLNKDLKIEGLVMNISQCFIEIHRWNCWNELIGENLSGSEDNPYTNRMLNFLFSFQNETWSNRLLTFKIGDYVTITGNIHFCIKGGVYGRVDSSIGTKKHPGFDSAAGDHTYCVFLDLIDIEKTTKPPLDSSSSSILDNCFIATACYGDSNAKEVLTLRNYRDTVLLKTKFGRTSIYIYYLISPPIAKLLNKSETLKEFVRKRLVDPFVSKIIQNQ